ncbi:uncharacterized protein LOC131209961 [Anopheles bellator]|uniref:uncharacterized protein LOC131209961 n=1 Tax=Anopheles bellator TaxID=139047 RepID=UPI002649FB4C|nr:uncharacterized protein LOC131209961 [Anopheles bellator]
MKPLTLVLTVFLLGGITVLLSEVSAAHLPVPYFDQRLTGGPLSSSDIAYLRRLVESESADEVTTVEPGSSEAGTWENSCLGETESPGDGHPCADESSESSSDESSIEEQPH